MADIDITGTIGPAETDEIISQAIAWQRDGKAVAIATVVSTWGSSPRAIGSQLAVNTDGAMLGSVSGGCIEGAVVTEALDAIADGKPRLLDFGVTDAEAWEVGLACGGKIEVFVEPVQG
jgi:xanthine/CO dehydrogenase XdhC/CoxF family maturation factor